MTATFTTTAVTRIRTWVVAATTRSTNHYTITAITAELFDDYRDKTKKITGTLFRFYNNHYEALVPFMIIHIYMPAHAILELKALLGSKSIAYTK